MVNWRTFGASVIGPGHIRAELPNQDSFSIKDASDSVCIAVSDGVGSAAQSDVGSKLACEAVVEAVERLAGDARAFDFGSFLPEIKENFMRKVSPLTIEECAATCLFAVCYAGNVAVGMLGDGVIAIQKCDGRFEVLMDDKSESFSNLVATFAADTSVDDWKVRVLPEAECRAVVLCTDGIGDDLQDVEGFMNGFIEEFVMMDETDFAHEVQALLTNWPTPKHCDDKTIACLLRKEVAHEGI